MNNRQKQLLKLLIQVHIREGIPVGSKALAEHADLGLSSATIRNEMAELERLGYIIQPHTSAGRVPTEKAYRYHVDDMPQDTVAAQKHIAQFNKDLAQKYDDAQHIKQAAKSLADISGETIILGLSPHNLFYTGIANLFQKPEFHDSNLIIDLSSVLDHFEDVMRDLHPCIKEPHIFIGSENPFHTQCSFIAGSFGHNSVIGILGPLRMDYQQNLSLIRHLTTILSSI